MTSLLLPLLLAGVAIVLGLVSVVLFYKVVIAPRNGSSSPSKAAVSSVAQAGASSHQSLGKTSRKQNKKPTQQCLFVVFDAPSQSINQALGEMLNAKNAFYELELGAFHLPPGPQGYPLMVASATSPGKLPPLHQEGEHTPVQGVSILIRFLNARKVSRNPDDLIIFTQDVAALGGQILDAKRNPITEDALAAMYQEGE
tara:strand:- start:9190 stop:9786 length:597 start_codon:yes stop_codon:yes gene_type:complete